VSEIKSRPVEYLENAGMLDLKSLCSIKIKSTLLKILL